MRMSQVWFQMLSDRCSLYYRRSHRSIVKEHFWKHRGPKNSPTGPRLYFWYSFYSEIVRNV